MQKLIGITGNMGSGKTTVSTLLEKMGAVLYNSDKRAKYLMENDANIRIAIIKILGQKAYQTDGSLNKIWVAKQIFQDDEKLKALKNIVHPAVKNDFEIFVKKTRLCKTNYILYESALIFEEGQEKLFHKIILVASPQKTALQRVIKRDNCSEKEAIERMKHQWGNDKKTPLCDFVIENTTLEKTKKQVAEIHKKIIT